MRSVHRSLLAWVVTGLCLTAAYAQPSTLVRDGIALPDPRVVAELPPYLASRSVQFADWLADGSMLVSTRVDEDRTQIDHLRWVGAMNAAASPRPPARESVSPEPPAAASVPASPSLSSEQVSFAPAGVAAAAARPYTSDAFAYVSAAADARSPQVTPSVPSVASARLYLQKLGMAPRLLAATRLDVGAPAWAHDGKRIAYAGAGDSGVYVLDTAASSATPQLVVGTAGAAWHVLGWSVDDAQLLLGRAPADPTPIADALADSVSARGPTDRSDGAPQPLDAELALYLADVHSGAVGAIPAPGAGSAAGRALAAKLALNSEQSTHGQASPALATVARFASDGHAIVLVTRASCERSGQATAAREFLHLCYTDPMAGEWRRLSAPAMNDVELFDQSPDGSWLAYTLNDAGASRLMLADQHLKLDSAVTSLPAGVITTLKFDAFGKHLAVTYESASSAPGVYVMDTGTRAFARWTEPDSDGLEAAGFVSPQLVHFPTWDQIDGEARQLSAWLYRPSAAPPTTTAGRAVVIWLCGGGGQQCRPGYSPFVEYLLQKQGCVVLAPNVRGSSGFGAAFEAAGAGALRDDAVRDVGSLLVWIGLQPRLDASRIAVLGEGYGSYLALASLAAFGDRLRGAVAAFPQHLWPLPNALAIRQPVLLVQGLADPNVPAYQAAQLREGLRASGVAVQYLAAGDEAGRFVRRSNRQAYDEAAASFLEHLLR